jgi:hypothetical protein
MLFRIFNFTNPKHIAKVVILIWICLLFDVILCGDNNTILNELILA